MRIIQVLSILFSLVSLSTRAQDTVTVYFDFGSSKLSEESTDNLGKISDRFDLSDVDSIQIIGYTDSVGKVAENLRLSLRRAKVVEKACKFTLGEIDQISLYARGEGTLDDPNRNRRVEIVMHSKKLKVDIDTAEIFLNKADPKCFFIDFEALEYCHIRTITKGKKESVFIEAMNVSVISSRDHFYADKNRDGEVIVKKVNWKSKKTGLLWWKKKRLVTTIPKSAFDRHKFFTLENGPCDGCKETILTEDTIVVSKMNYYADRFLMDNVQAKVRFFKKKEVNLRVPKMYVDESDKYYLNNDFSRSELKPRQQLNWETKQGKRKQDYYFTTIQFVNDELPIIIRGSLTTECQNKYNLEGKDDSGSSSWGRIKCGTHMIRPVTVGFQINADLGAFYQNDSLTGFLALGISHTTYRGLARLMGGINTHLGFYGSLSYQYHYFSFPWRTVRPVNMWRSPSDFKVSSIYVRLYAGAESKVSFNRSYLSFFEGNLHTGFVLVNAKDRSTFPRFYFQGGVGYDFTGNSQQLFYPIAQIGFTVRIGSFKIPTRKYSIPR